MRKSSLVYILLLGAVMITSSCTRKEANILNINIERAESTLDSLYKYYSVKGTSLLRETYPFDESYIATYTASENPSETNPNPYSYLWPFSGTLSAVSILTETDQSGKYRDILEKKVLPGLEEYYDDKRTPPAYASYINSAPESDRFYDDNVWLGIDFADLYLSTGETKYLDKSEMIWKFIESGMDDELGGGIYWCEQKKRSKNTCSNAPGSVYALKLYLATKQEKYLDMGRFLYDWSKNILQDKEDHLYFDNINLEGKIDKHKFAYNSGQMIQAAALLYKITGDKMYLEDAENIAEAGYNFFFYNYEPKEQEGSFKLLKRGNIWFSTVMFRGYVELYEITGNGKYMDAFRNSLDHAWHNSRDEHGLFNTDWSGERKDATKWLLTQAAMVEMYARMGVIDTEK